MKRLNSNITGTSVSMDCKLLNRAGRNLVSLWNRVFKLSIPVQTKSYPLSPGVICVKE